MVTTNTFFGCLLAINFLYILAEICILSEINEQNGVAVKDEFVRALDPLFLDYYKSFLCSAQYLAGFIFTWASMDVLLGIIFIRMMMIKYANKIQTTRFINKGQKAHLRIIGILVAVWIIALITNNIINLILFPFFPFDFFPVKSCRGVVILYDEEEQQMIFRGWLIRLINLVLMAVAALTSHARVLLFRRHHSLSYFSKYRQNIATLDQTLMAAYLKIFLAILKEMNFIPILINSHSIIEDELFMKIMNLVNCTVVPCYWVFSTKQHFKEFWSKETIFLKRLSPPTNVAPQQNVGDQGQGASTMIIPRREEYQDTSFINVKR